MKKPIPPAATVVCIGGNCHAVRSICAHLKHCGYRAIAVITDVNPDCTLPLISTLTPDAILVSDDLPGMSGTSFTASLRRLHPGAEILLLADGSDLQKRMPSHVESWATSDSSRDLFAELSGLLTTMA